MSKPNGWQLRNRKMMRHEIIAQEPTRWDKLLLKHSLDEFVNKPVLSDAEILRLLAHERRQEIVKWTIHNYNSVFIPESWILACGLDSRWIS